MPTRKIVIDLDVEADDEATLNKIEAVMVETYIEGRRHHRNRLGEEYWWTILAVNIVNEGPVEI